MAFLVTSVYDSEVLEEMLTQATTRNELVEKRVIRTEFLDGAPKLAIPRVRAGNMLQRRKEQPVITDAKGDVTIDERYLEPKDAMVLGDFNPRTLEKFWRKYQPKGPLVFHELPQPVQSKMLMLIAEMVDFELYDVLLNGTYYAEGDISATGTRLDLANGFLFRIKNDPAVIDVPTPVALTGGSSGNIVAKMEQARKLVRKPIRKDSNLVYLMSTEDHDKYCDFLRSQPNKGPEYTESGPERYNGIRIIPLTQMPENTFVMTLIGNSLKTNLWAGFDYARDAETLQIDKWDNAGERYFIKMLLKIDTQLAWGDDAVLYTV